MDRMKGLGMKGPMRQAPPPPAFTATRYSPITNWNDDPFGSDLFEPAPSFQEKKKPPPRPPPPKLKTQPDIPAKPSHFNRKPTILSSLMSRKDKTQKVTTQTTVQTVVHQKFSSEYHNEAIQKTFPKCEVRNVQTASLIDLSSPPSSPTFTTRSSSDGVSVDSFGSDATSSTSQQRTNGNQSQAESGFEDDFDLFLTNRKPMCKEDTMDDFANFDPFSPVQTKPPILKKPNLSKINDQLLCNGKTVKPAVHTHKVPTIIRAKPARPKPPENSALLKLSLNTPTAVPMNLNMSVPIERINTGTDYNNSSSAIMIDWSPERESSPPMPRVPPPPPPVIDDSDLPEPVLEWPADNVPEVYSAEPRPFIREGSIDVEEPYAVAVYDYLGYHPDDLSFETNAKIKLIRRMDSEWLFGRVRSGAEGVFPANHVDIRVPLPGETIQPPPRIRTAVALYEFQPSHPGDLRMAIGDKIQVLDMINEDWWFGECKGNKGQFPANYVQML